MFLDFGGNISLRRKRHDPSIEWSDDGINCEYCSDVAWASSRLKPPATRLWVESSDSFHKCPVIWKACLCHDAIILRRVSDILSIGSKISLCYITWKHEFITDSMSTSSLGIRWPAVISLFLVHRLPYTFTSNDGNYLIFSISFFSQFSGITLTLLSYWTHFPSIPVNYQRSSKALSDTFIKSETSPTNELMSGTSNPSTLADLRFRNQVALSVNSTEQMVTLQFAGELWTNI